MKTVQSQFKDSRVPSQMVHSLDQTALIHPEGCLSKPARRADGNLKQTTALCSGRQLAKHSVSLPPLRAQLPELSCYKLSIQIVSRLIDAATENRLCRMDLLDEDGAPASPCPCFRLHR
jgi:hypothetical protein